jgi:lipoprotein-releasing system ATP-binding protein
MRVMLKAEGVSKSYPGPSGPVDVLSNVSLELSRGEAAAIMGPSGTGKSTLLYLLGALDTPTAGAIALDGNAYSAMDDRAQAAFRNRNIGFVFQDHALLPHCSALENVIVPALVAEDRADYEGRARELLDRVGLAARMDHKPAQLSGGERQRVAIARALVCKPSVLLCDEPTGNLDAASSRSVADLLLELHGQQQTVLIVVTHSTELAQRFPIQFQLVERRLQRV